MDLLRELADMGLGFIREGRRLPNHAAGLRSLEFHRSPLTPQISARLEDLNVPLAFWTPQQRNATAPHMAGAGKAMMGSGQKTAEKTEKNFSVPATTCGRTCLQKAADLWESSCFCPGRSSQHCFLVQASLSC